jgi:UDP-N-acetylmuramoylalanine--D-glutamate ligase
VWLGGNILIAPLSFLSRVRSADLVVLELSSFQLEAIGEAGYSPSVACLTNLLTDHLNAYEDMAAYGEAKAQIFRHQRPDDVLVVNGDDAFCRTAAVEAPGVVRRFHQRKQKTSDAWITSTALVLKEGTREITVIEKKKLWVGGDHAYRNMCAAVLTARAAGASIAAIRKALQQFRGLPDRQEVIAQQNVFCTLMTRRRLRRMR